MSMRRYYSESLAYVPSSFYPLNHGAPITATPPRGHAGIHIEKLQMLDARTWNLNSLPAGLLGSGKEGVTFACFNRNLKIKPDIFSAW
jgi:predicted O-linked N-acetylglucosamine transferase (SPINDLY family)